MTLLVSTPKSLGGERVLASRIISKREFFVFLLRNKEFLIVFGSNNQNFLVKRVVGGMSKNIVFNRYIKLMGIFIYLKLIIFF